MDSSIVCCDCPGIPERARAAYKVRIGGPDQAIFAGRGSVCTLADRLKQGSDIEQHIRALSRNKEKYAYYFEWDSDGKIKMKYNLLTGKEVA